MEFRLRLEPFPVTGAEEVLEADDHSIKSRRRIAWPIVLTVVLVFLIHGYHPYCQDGSIYVADIESHLDASLFRPDSVFIGAHTRSSLFFAMMAALVRLGHISLETALLLAYVGTTAAFLYGCWLLAARVFRCESASWTATLLAACCFTIPAAASSLMLMDPYVTARSFSTPASLFAIVCCLDRSWLSMSAFALIAVSMNPLMGIYLVCFLVVLIFLERLPIKVAAAFCVAGFAAAGILSRLSASSPVSEAWRRSLLDRPYYFLVAWQWYEVIGLVAPMLLLSLVWRDRMALPTAWKLCAACILYGGTAALISLCFVRPSHPDLLMRLQVLRTFLTIYSVGLVIAGGYLGARLWASNRWMVVSALAVAAVAMFVSGRLSYPMAAYIQSPFGQPADRFERAFLWIRANTPHDAVFAADSQWFHSDNKDSVGFRAMTQRSIVMDIKDEGLASLFPTLAEEWERRYLAASGLNRLDDSQRAVRLQGYGVGWVLLSAAAPTSSICPYRDTEVAVCELGP